MPLPIIIMRKGKYNKWFRLTNKSFYSENSEDNHILQKKRKMNDYVNYIKYAKSFCSKKINNSPDKSDIKKELKIVKKKLSNLE